MPRQVGDSRNEQSGDGWVHFRSAQSLGCGSEFDGLRGGELTVA
jgi:hypothetical protein